MNLDEFIAMMFSNKTSAYEGLISVRETDVRIHSEIKADVKGVPIMINNISISKTNVALSATYLIDLSKDTKEEVIIDIETLVPFMLYGIEKVAKEVKPIE